METKEVAMKESATKEGAMKNGATKEDATKDGARPAPLAGEEAAPLGGELGDYSQQLKAIGDEARRLTEQLTNAQFNWRVAEGSWSIGECLAHLNLTGQMYLPRIERAMRQARAAGLTGSAPFRHGWFGNFFVRRLEPPVRRLKVRAPRTVEPPPEHLLAVVVPAFMSLQEQLDKKLREAEGLHLSRIKISSPFSRYLSFSLGQSFALLAAHERRHLWQARQVREHPGFPSLSEH